MRKASLTTDQYKLLTTLCQYTKAFLDKYPFKCCLFLQKLVNLVWSGIKKELLGIRNSHIIGYWL